MSNNKKSSLEWLVEELFPKNDNIRFFCHPQIFEKAKEMREKEYFEFFKAGQESMEEGGKGFEHYYNQTFGGDNEQQ
jgi:hypothetical protein